MQNLYEEEEDRLSSIAPYLSIFNNDKEKAMEYIYDATKKYVFNHYGRNKSIPKDCLDDMIQETMIHLYESDLNKYDPQKGGFESYLYSCIENAAKKSRFVNDSMCEKDYSKRLRSKIQNDYHNNHLSIKEIMRKYNIKKESTVNYYLNWDGQIYSLDFTDEDGNNLYNRISSKTENIEEDYEMNEQSIKERLEKLGFCDEKSIYILTKYIQQVYKSGVKRGAQKQTVEICQSESLLTKKEIIDVIHKYNDSLKQ